MSSIIYIFLVDEKETEKKTLSPAFIVLFNQTVALNSQSSTGNFINAPCTFNIIFQVLILLKYLQRICIYLRETFGLHI
jgi:hypothetical protein